MILGTPDYMSPEQAMGRSVTHRSDQFAAGAVFYEFLTGSKPFRGKTLHSVLYQILSEEPEPLLTLNPGLPARLAAVVHGMMRKDPERRYASMDDVRRELSRSAPGAAAHAGPLGRAAGAGGPVDEVAPARARPSGRRPRAPRGRPAGPAPWPSWTRRWPSTPAARRLAEQAVARGARPGTPRAARPSPTRPARSA